MSKARQKVDGGARGRGASNCSPLTQVLVKRGYEWSSNAEQSEGCGAKAWWQRGETRLWRLDNLAKRTALLGPTLVRLAAFRDGGHSGDSRRSEDPYLLPRHWVGVAALELSK